MHESLLHLLYGYISLHIPLNEQISNKIIKVFLKGYALHLKDLIPSHSTTMSSIECHNLIISMCNVTPLLYHRRIEDSFQTGMPL